MKISLQAGEEQQLPIMGKTVVYVAGSEELKFTCNEQAFQISSGGQVTADNRFDRITIKNMGSGPVQATINIIDGEFQRISDVSIVQIQGITDTIKAMITSLPAVDVQSLPAVDVQSLPAADIQSLPEVVQKDVSNILTTDYENSAIGSLTIPAKAGRKRVTIQGYSESDNTIICRVSDTSKSSSSGQFLPVGAGLLSSLEMQHAAAMKVWFPNSETVYLSVLEEF